MARNRGLSGVGIGSGFDALVGLEGFMRGWDFGQSINREKEDKADREYGATSTAQRVRRNEYGATILRNVTAHGVYHCVT